MVPGLFAKSTAVRILSFQNVWTSDFSSYLLIGSYFSAAMIGNMLADILFKKSHADESITPSSSITSLALQSSTPVASEGGVVKESASHQQGNFSGMLACSTPTADGAVSSDKSTTESSIVDNNKDSSIDKKGQHKDVEDEAEIKTSTPSDFLKASTCILSKDNYNDDN